MLCNCGKTIRKLGEIQCSSCKKKYSPKFNIPKTTNYSSPSRLCLCGKKIRDITQLSCSACRKKRGY